MSNSIMSKNMETNIKTKVIEACYKNDLTLAKQLLSDCSPLNIINIVGYDRNPQQYPLYNPLYIACEYKYFEFAEWLLSLNPNKENYEEVFINLCYYSHLDAAKWLLSKKPTIDITIKNNYAFVWACEYSRYIWSFEQLEMAKWLVSLKPYHYILELDNFGCFISYSIRKPKDIKWLERRIPLLAYYNTNIKDKNDFKRLNFDVIRKICLFI